MGWPTNKAAQAAAKQIAHRALHDVGWKDCLDSATSALDAAGLPELVSHAEVRAILGTRNPRLPAGTPAPLYPDVGGRALWLRDDIVEFAKEFQARPHVRSRRAKSET